MRTGRWSVARLAPLGIALALLVGGMTAARARSAGGYRANNYASVSRTNVYGGHAGYGGGNADVGRYDYGRFGDAGYYGAASGSYVESIPTDCGMESTGGISYYSCNGRYYQPVYQGPDVVYQVARPPG